MTSCRQELRSPIWAARRFRGTNSITINLKENDDVIIARLCDFGKTFYFLFKKGYVDHILAAGLATDNN